MFVFIQVQEPAGNAVRDNKKNRGVNLLGMGELARNEQTFGVCDYCQGRIVSQ